jgi:hypothetical protein
MRFIPVPCQSAPKIGFYFGDHGRYFDITESFIFGKLKGECVGSLVGEKKVVNDLQGIILSYRGD